MQRSSQPFPPRTHRSRSHNKVSGLPRSLSAAFTSWRRVSTIFPVPTKQNTSHLVFFPYQRVEIVWAHRFVAKAVPGMQETLHSGMGLEGLGHAGVVTDSPGAPPSQQPDADKWNSNAPERDRHEAIEVDGDVKKQRRKSRLGLLTSIFPLLTSSSTDPNVRLPRKPVTTQSQFQTAPSTNDPGYLPNPLHNSGLGLGLGIERDLPPVAPVPLTEPPRIPAQDPESHARRPSLPAVLKKVQKAGTAVLHSHPPAMETQAQISERKARDRAKSASPARGKLQPNRLQPPDVQPASAPKLRSSSAQPPKGRLVSAEAPRVVSNPTDARPQSQSSEKTKRRSWLPGSRSRSNSHDLGKVKGAGAWIIAPDDRSDYHTTGLENGDKV